MSIKKPECNYLDKKVVILSLTNRMGGAEQILLMIADVLKSPLIFLKKANKHQLQLSSEHSVKYISKKSLLEGFILLPQTLFKYRKGYVIISSHAYLNAYLGFLKRIGYLKSQLIVRESTSLFSRYTGGKKLSYQLAYKIGYPAAGLIICQTNSMRKELLQHNPYISKANVITLDNAINLETAKAKGNEPLIDPLTEDEFICAAGRLIPIKGFDLLIKAFKEISILSKQLKLILLGEGPERDNLNRLIQEFDLQDRVFLKGHIANPYPYFKKAKICVVSSIQEGFPNVLLQMMALNERVVSTNCAGGVEDIPGIAVVKPNNIEGLTKGIKRLFNEGYDGKRTLMDQYLIKRSPQYFVTKLFERLK